MAVKSRHTKGVSNSARRRFGALFAVIFVCIQCAAVISGQEARERGPSDPGVRRGPAGAGDPLPGSTQGQLRHFLEGKEAFDEVNFVRNPPPDGDAGLGPRFNSDSCGSCHAFPAAGGSSPAVNPQIAVATKMGANNRIPPFLTQDGPVREVRF
jgi:hypothetical protein